MGQQQRTCAGERRQPRTGRWGQGGREQQPERRQDDAGSGLFKHRRDPSSFFDDKDSGKAFSTSDGIKSSTSFSLANYYLIQGRAAEAKDHLRRAMQIDTWSFFARVQAEADWIQVYGEEKP